MKHQLTGQLPLSVLTGFLGSGKTTMLNHLIQQPAFNRTLVLINEFGEIGLDHKLLVSSDDHAVIEMSSGCICCTFRADLVKTLKDAPWRFSRGGELWFDRVVIETTGIADPAPILHTLMKDADIAGRYRLDGVIATVDSVNGGATLDQHIECTKQVAVADRLLITKTDLTDADHVAELQTRLRELNPAAPQLITDNGKIDPGLLFDVGLYSPETKSASVQNWLRAEAYGDAPGLIQLLGRKSRHDARIQSTCLTIDRPIRREALDVWLKTLVQFDGADLLRVKGILNIAGLDSPLVIHGVQHVFHTPVTLKAWPGDDRNSRIVFITYGIDASALRATLPILRDDASDELVTQSAAPSASGVPLPEDD